MNTYKIIRGLIAFLLVATTMMSLAYADHTIGLTAIWTANDETRLSVDQGANVEFYASIRSTYDYTLSVELLQGTDVVRTIVPETVYPATLIDDASSHTIGFDTDDLAGLYTVRIQVVNREGDDTQYLTLDVETSPVISVSPRNYEVDEGEVLRIPRIVTVDQDGDDLTVSLSQLNCVWIFCVNSSSLDDDLSITRNDGVITSITYTPGYDEIVHPNTSRRFILVLQAYDGEHYSPEERLTIRVHDVNQIPNILSVPVTEAEEGSLYNYLVVASDEDDEDTLTYTLTAAPEGMTMLGSTVGGFIRWTPDYNDAGDHDVTILVSDGIDSVEQRFTITVDNTNRAPILNSIGDKTVIAGDLLKFTVSATDIDGDELEYRLEDFDVGARGGIFVDNNDGTATFSWTPSRRQVGVYDATFIVSDEGAEDSESITITVLPVPAEICGDDIDNDRDGRADEGCNTAPPVLDPIGDRTVVAGELLKFTVSASDEDGDRLLFRLEDFDVDAMGGVFVDNDNGTATFSWTPSRRQVGAYDATFIVSDGEFEDSEAIIITVVSSPIVPPEVCGDSIDNDGDNCPLTFNPTQADA